MKLSPGQVTTLAAAAEGKSNKEIAYEQGVSIATVKSHMTLAMRKLRASNRWRAALRARELGLLP